MAIFNPTREQVRDFFIQTWQKYQHKAALSAMEKIALGWIMKHPEYHAMLDNPEARNKDFSVAEGQTNPFLHLSMHIALEEQISIDNPHGIREVFEQLSAKLDEHAAHHEMMECLGQVIWQAQRNRGPLDQQLYIELLKQRVNTH
ncbi:MULTISPECIES: DUF1841 family protein [Oligella]|uniref:Domain of uncharacterized function (DUF1841) n=1 Tax=Oligella urethralis TaxID=90245 RepID=A0A2N6QG98_9BURK|nr:DUF1841 domain-containing protein [Oligella urethralis]OFS82847.1 hypothetical protein HMPREF3144_10220 [Oligella sp. HMSC05A10]OFV46536.1 hypothetical protein HMPREF3179_09910 [Oligella sp. HMSC09E12]PMC18598.1 DUF1841 domain-containing protein [Oligella urethralis]WOS38238.1 hypothetical protein RP300_01805 [Oligella urethralis]